MRRLGRALDMLRIELSALSAQELKRLLDMARARNQTALIHQLNAELERRPTRVEDWSPLPMNYARPDYAAAEVDVAPPRRNGMMAATAALAAFVSAAVTWGLSVPPPQPSAIEAPRAAVVLASLAPVGPPAGFSEPPPEGTLAEPEPAPVQLARETLRPAGVVVRRTVGVKGHAHHQCRGLPLADQLGDGGKARVTLDAEGLQRLGQPHQRIASGHAYAPSAEVEGQKGLGTGRGNRKARPGRRALRHARPPG